MTSMIERVARAICNMNPGAGATYEQAAKAAIEAMREPTSAILDVLAEEHCYDDAWSDCIDAALKETAT